MSKMNPGVLFDASRSWNGYNHQGKLALVYAIGKITELVGAESSAEEDRALLLRHFLEIEYMEDFSVGRFRDDGEAEYVSVHQVKDRKETAPSEYTSAIQGLAKHLVDMPGIEDAYLHVTSSLNLKKPFEEYVSKMVTNTKWLDTHIAQARAAGDQELTDELEELKRKLADFPPKQMAKIRLYEYPIGGGQTYCPEDHASVLLKEALRAFYQKKDPGTHKPEKKYVGNSYLYVMGRLDQHVVDRSLNFDAYMAEKKDRRILYAQIYDWLVSEEIGEQGEEFYLYHIKERYFALAEEGCKNCPKAEECPPDCQVHVFRDRLGTLSFEELKTFLYRTNPDVRCRIDQDTYVDFLQKGKVKNPFLKGLREIGEKILGGKNFDAVSYRDGEDLQYALTTIARDDPEDESEDPRICETIQGNDQAFRLLMDYDRLISRDVRADTIFSVNISEAEDTDGRGAENIMRPRKVGIVTLKQFQKTMGEGR